MKKIGLVCLALVIALGTLGVGYAMWDKYVYIETTVNTGEVNAVFCDAFTDDDGVVNDILLDAGDDGGGTLYDYWGVWSSNDPSSYGPNPDRYNKDVGYCTAYIYPPDPQQLYFSVYNAYPSYHNTLWFCIENTGTVPVNIERLILTPQSNMDIDGDQIDDITVALSELAENLQIDPGDKVWGNLEIHINQTAVDTVEANGGENEYYYFTLSIWLVQWNEPQPDTP